MKKPARVVLLGRSMSCVPPIEYSGIERIIHALASGLQRAGVDTTVMAGQGRSDDYPVVHWLHDNPTSIRSHLANIRQVDALIAGGRSDVIVHGFYKIAYLLPFALRNVAAVHSYQLMITVQNAVWAKRLSLGRLSITACSESMVRNDLLRTRVHVIHNMVPLEKYTAEAHVDATAPLVFLGRIHRSKGAHNAIAVARNAGRRLVIAGIHSDDGEEGDYWKQEIAPHLDGDRVTYAGPVNDAQKNDLLGRAAALLFPIEWEEPFGIVMIEAMACGTPVLAFARGAVREVLRDGVNGFLCTDNDDMARRVGDLPRIDRRGCRDDVEARFSDRVIVNRYLELYEAILERRHRA